MKQSLEWLPVHPPPQLQNSLELHLNGGSILPLNENHKLDADALITNDDILGDEIPFDQMKSLRESCNKMLNLNVKRTWEVSRVTPSFYQQGQFTTSK